jgi:hypothetical protein
VSIGSRGAPLPLRVFALYSPILEDVPYRSCAVSFTDSEGIEHRVQVSAATMYEAAVEALAAFQRSGFSDSTFGPATRLTIRVKAPEEEHTVTVAKLNSWLDGGAKSPNEQVQKKRLKERLTKR